MEKYIPVLDLKGDVIYKDNDCRRAETPKKTLKLRFIYFKFEICRW